MISLTENQQEKLHNENMTEITDPVCSCVIKGIIGFTVPICATVFSLLHDIEAWLRVLSLVGGLVVCGLTIISLSRGLCKKTKKKKQIIWRDE